MSEHLFQRIVVELNGGRPWGFSIKGGMENDKPLVVSKLEDGGKAEASGLCIGDVLLYVNDKPLSGYRDEAVHSIRLSGDLLVLEIERSALYRQAGISVSGPKSRPECRLCDVHAHPTHAIDEQRDYDEFQPAMHSFSHSQYENNFFEPTNYTNDLRPSPQEQIYHPPDVAPYLENVYATETIFDSHKSNPDFNDGYGSKMERNEYPSQPIVKLRARKARDRGVATERPRSWHSSKSTSFDYTQREDTTMRSPESGGYAFSSQAHHRFGQAKNNQSKGWNESGDLKSVYKPVITDSKDSLFSGESHRSYKSARLSVSSSRSSGTMSSSRGSLENLVEEREPTQTDFENCRQIILTSSTKQFKHDSPSQPLAGIVSQQRNMFERLSQKSASPGPEPKTFDFSNAKRISSDSSDKKYRHSSIHMRHNSQSPSECSGDSSRPSSVASPPATLVPEKEIRYRKRSYEKSSDSSLKSKQEPHRVSAYEKGTFSRTDIETKPADNLPIKQERYQTTVSSPRIQKDNTSEKAARSNHQHSKSYSALSSFANQDAKFQYPSYSKNSQNSLRKSSELTSRLPASDAGSPTYASRANAKENAPTERVFGVVVTGKNGSIAAKSMTMPSKVKDHQSASLKSDNSSVRNENLRHFAKNYDSKSKVSTESEHVPKNIEHIKSVSADSNTKGKYGSVWKTPQTHRRTRSTDFSSVLKDWSVRSPQSPEQLKLSVFEDQKHEESKTDQKMSHKNNFSGQKQVFDFPTTGLPCILKSLQNSQTGENLYRNLEPKSFTEQYDKQADTKEKQKENIEITPANIPWSSKRKVHNNISDWKSQFKEVDLDEFPDESCSPQDRYVYDIKDMSSKVLHVTSFTRKDLGASSLQPASDNRKRFPSQADQFLQPPVISHGRSRSHGSEIEEGSESLSARSEKKAASQPAQVRPKSAGVSRQSNRHAPVMRATMAPACDRPTSYYARKSDSLPRNSFSSYEWEDIGSPTLSVKSPSPLGNTLNASNDSVGSPAVERVNKKIETRNAVLDFISRKTGVSFDSVHSQLASPPSAYSSHSDEGVGKINAKSEEKLVKKSSANSRKTSSSHLRGRKSRSPERVEKKKGIKDDKNQSAEEKHSSHQQSNSSLLDEEDHFHRSEHAPSITSGERSASFDNLTDSGLDLSRASPSEQCETDRLSLSRSDELKSPAFESLTAKHELIKPHLRKHPKPYRQRFSNSSSASSATTISTLSSLSSASSTSIGRFPALGEEVEQPAANHKHDSESLPLQDLPAKPALPCSPLITKLFPLSDRSQIDTGTYRVPNRNAGRKATKTPGVRSNVRGKNAEVHRSIKTIIMTAPHSEGQSTQDNKENKEANLPEKKQTKTNEIFKSKETLLEEVQQNVYEIIEKVKSASMRNQKTSTLNTSHLLPPPPPTSLPYPLEDAAEQLLSAIAQQRKSLSSVPSSTNSTTSTLVLEKAEKTNKSPAQPSPDRFCDATSPSADHQRQTQTPTALGPSQSAIYQVESNSEALPDPQIPSDSEFLPKSSDKDNKQGHFKPINSFVDQSPPNFTPPPEIQNSLDLANSAETALAESSQPELHPLVSPVPLLPDVSLFPNSLRTSLQEDHPELTHDIIKGDKALAQVFSTNNKTTSDYMAGILAQPSYDIIEQGMRYRRRKPLAMNFDFTEMNNNNQLMNDVNRHNLPASSTYYKTSASKGKILSLMKEKLAEGEIHYQEEETCDEVNRKKLELILSIKAKLDDLNNMKGLLDVEMRENESLGRQVFNLAKSVCTQKEQEKYNIFVQDVDKIINLLLSLSGRLARVENAIQMLPADAEKQEMNQLCEKRRKLTEQHKEAKQLKENIDRRQKIVSEILATHLNREQFADYEHYIKMKSALIMEQRELDDKTKLGREQMQCLRDSLPEDWQSNLDKLIGE